MKLPAHSAGLPGNDLLLNIVPLDPAHRAGLAGHAPVNEDDCLRKPISHPTYSNRFELS